MDDQETVLSEYQFPRSRWGSVLTGVIWYAAGILFVWFSTRMSDATIRRGVELLAAIFFIEPVIGYLIYPRRNKVILTNKCLKWESGKKSVYVALVEIKSVEYDSDLDVTLVTTHDGIVHRLPAC